MPIRRGNTYSTRMRVPARFKSVEPRDEVWISLGTADLEQARIAEVKLRAAQLAEWEERAGTGDTPEERYQRLAAIAAAKGFGYMPAADLAKHTLDELLARVKALDTEKELTAVQSAAAATTANPALVSALLGGAEEPVVMLSGLLEYVEGLDVTRTANRYKNDEQLRLWRSPRRRAIENLRKALKDAGKPDDLPVEQITHDIARQHHRWWGKRLALGKLSVDTAEKDYSNMSGMLRDFWDAAGKQSPKPYSGLSHRDRFKKPNRKPEFLVEWIAETIAAPGAMHGLNDEAKAIVAIVAETGCRQSEVYNAPPGSIVLDVPIPYIAIEPEDEGEIRRDIKNVHSIRRMPLVGIALEAAKRFPNGFPTYCGNSNFSATVNKWFRENNKFPSPRHTIGGLRHSFESRMKAIGLDNEDRGTLMGHSRKLIRGREVYGDDLDLEMRWCVAMLIGIGPLVEGPERESMARRLRKLLDDLKEAGD